MMKTTLLFSTIWFALVSFNLPNINSVPTCGKSIKATEICSPGINTPDSNEVVVVSDARFVPDLYKINTVVIDPGHGGHDPGCSGSHSHEKHIALSIGKYLAEDLKGRYPGLNVIMTRSTDVFVPLHKRASIATENKADLFISIHCNAFSRSEVKGTETYVLGLHATKENLAVAKRENEAILLEDNYKETYGFDPDSPEAHIMFSMFQNAFLDQSILFAEKIQGQSTAIAGRKDRGVKQAGFLVLRYATMPSVLVETGYLTNYVDEAYLATDEGQRKMAFAISNAFGEYKKEMDGGKEEVATVAYVELKEVKSNSTVSEPERQNKIVSADPPKPKVADNYLDESQRKEAAIAKKWGLEIGMPTEKAIATSTNMNTSPRKTSKISPTVPINESGNPNATVSKPNKISIKVDEPEKKPEPVKVLEPKSVDVQFCVQLAASPKLLNVSRGKWTSINQTIEVVEEGNLFKYQVRNFATLAKAEEVKSDLRRLGFSDAFVVAYKNGEKVDPRKLK